MSSILFQGPNLSRFLRNGNQSQRATFSPKMNLNLPSSQSKMQEDLSVEVQNLPIPEVQSSRPSDIRFDRIQTSDVRDATHRLEFGRYVAREALVDEEYWTAAWLRAESHWEDKPPDRYMESYKRKFADQIKKEEKNVKRTVIKSIVGTLDLSFRNLLQGEMFPGENEKAPTFCNINEKSTQRYGYVANLCVAKFSRRKGIASNMLGFAIESARLKGVEQVFVHVHRQNTPAHELYEKLGFQIVEMAPNLSADENYLMRFKP